MTSGRSTADRRRPCSRSWPWLSIPPEIGANGLGLCTGTISDAGGVYGEVSQPLLVRAR